VSPCLFFSYKGSSYVGFRTHSNPVWPHLYSFPSAKSLFPNEFTFTGSGRTWVWGNTLQPNTVNVQAGPLLGIKPLPHGVAPCCSVRELPSSRSHSNMNLF
jgi:hypothetical protein